MVPGHHVRREPMAAVQGKVVAAVCHGGAALTEAKLDGEYFVKGKKVRIGATIAIVLRLLLIFEVSACFISTSRRQ